MKLLDELRNLDVAAPGRWSARVSVLLGCSVFLLIVFVGVRFRTLGHTYPSLEETRAQIAALEQQLAATRSQARATQNIREEVTAGEERLVGSGAWIPLQAQALDLPASLAAGPGGAPVEAVRPWQPGEPLPGPLLQAGAELKLTGGYWQVLERLDLALRSSQLRELAELSIEPPGADEPGPLRANIRLLACFGGSGAAGLLRAPPPVEAAMPAPESRFSQLESRSSPFGAPPGATTASAEPLLTGAGEGPRRRGLVRVGARQYELVEDSQGRFNLRSDG